MSQLPFASDTFEVVCRLGLLTGDGADSDSAPDVLLRPVQSWLLPFSTAHRSRL